MPEEPKPIPKQKPLVNAENRTMQNNFPHVENDNIFRKNLPTDNESIDKGKNDLNNKIAIENPNNSANEAFYSQIEELKNIVISLGRDKSVVDKMNLSALISEMRIMLGEKRKYKGETLSDEEIKDLESYLADEPRLFKIINKSNLFLKSLEGNIIIVVEQEY